VVEEFKKKFLNPLTWNCIRSQGLKAIGPLPCQCGDLRGGKKIIFRPAAETARRSGKVEGERKDNFLRSATY